MLSSHDGSTGGLDVGRIIETAKIDLTGHERGLAGVDDDVGHSGGARTESSTYGRLVFAFSSPMNECGAK